MELQIGGAVFVPVRALVLQTVISDGNRPVAVGNSHVRRQPAAERLVAGAVLRTGGCRNGYQHGTVLVLLNDPDAAGGDGEELDEEVGFLAALEPIDGVGDFLALECDLVIAADGAVVVEIEAQAAVQAEETLKAVVEREERLAEVVKEGEQQYAVPHPCLVLAAGIEAVHEARQVPALVQAHADGQAAVEVGLADDVPAAAGEMLLVAGTGFEQEIELAVVLEADNVLAAQAAGDLAQDALLFLEHLGRRQKGVLPDENSLFHHTSGFGSAQIWRISGKRQTKAAENMQDSVRLCRSSPCFSPPGA